MKTLTRYLGVAALAGMTGFAGQALASTADNTVIVNEVTVTYEDAAGNAGLTATAYAYFEVNLVASAPLVGDGQSSPTVTEGQTAAIIYTVTGRANGEDTYTVAVGAGSTDTNMDGAASFTSSSPTPITLGGTTLAADAAAVDTTITVPFDGTSDNIVNGIAAGDRVVIDPDGAAIVLTVATVGTPISEPASTNIVANATQTATITFTTAIGSAVTAGVIIGEQQDITVTYTANTVTAPNTSGSHVFTPEFTSVDDPTQTGTPVTDTTINVNSNSVLTIAKYVRNDSNTANNPATPAGDTATIDTTVTNYWQNNEVTADPGDTLQYLIVITNTGGGVASDVIVDDPIPLFTTYNGAADSIMVSVGDDVFTTAGDTETNAAADDQAEYDSTVGAEAVLVSPGGIPNGVLGSIAGNQSVYIIFDVTLD